MLTIAHVSDLHIGGRPESDERAARVLAHVCAMRPAPDVLVVTGDVADHGWAGGAQAAAIRRDGAAATTTGVRRSTVAVT